MIRAWRKVDEMYLRDNWGKKNEADIAQTLKRTTNSCRQKARALGLCASQVKKAPNHQRMKDKLSRPANREERLFMGWVVLQGCIVPGCNKPANFHHEPFRSQGGNHKSGCGLCKFHHQDGKHGRHAMSLDRFIETYGVNPLEISQGNWSKFKNGKEMQTQINEVETY